MQALPIAPVDLPAVTPSTSPAPKAGDDGLFAARLEAATRQQQTTTAMNASDRTGRVSGSKFDSERIPSGPDSDQRDTKTAEDTPATSLNGSAGAAQQAVSVELQTNSATPPPAAASASETAIARMLDVLSKGGGATLRAAASPVDATNATKPAVESVMPTEHIANGTPIQQSVPPTQAPFTMSPESAGISTAHITGVSSHPNPSQINTTGQGAYGGSATISVAPQGTDPQPPANTTPAAAALLLGSVSPAENKGGPSQVEIPPAQSAQTPAPAQTGIQGTIPIPEQTETSGTSGATQGGNPLYVQNKFGQIIAIQQNISTSEESEADGPADAVATNSGQRLDTNSNFIHSHLPKDTADKGTEQNSGQSAVTMSKPQQGTTAAGEQPGNSFAEQVALQNNQTPTISDSQPLVFSQPVTSSPTATITTPGQSTVYHLASGLMVPEGTVVDQMISHFAANRRLDTGEVTLRLYPQELGEVRMAIKVEQDNVKAHIIAQNPQAQEMIDRHLPRLREALEQQGLNLHQVEVTVAAHDNPGSERFQDSNAWRQPTASTHHSHAEQSIFSLESDEIMTADTTAANTTLSVLA